MQAAFEMKKFAQIHACKLIPVDQNRIKSILVSNVNQMTVFRELQKFLRLALL